MIIVIFISAVLLYYLAYISPKTDLILYGFSGILFIISAIAGFSGYSDIQTGENIIYEYSTYNNETVIQSTSTTPIYTQNKLNNTYVPIVEIFLGLYIIISLNLNENGTPKKSRNKTE